MLSFFRNILQGKGEMKTYWLVAAKQAYLEQTKKNQSKNQIVNEENFYDIHSTIYQRKKNQI